MLRTLRAADVVGVFDKSKLGLSEEEWQVKIAWEKKFSFRTYSTSTRFSFMNTRCICFTVTAFSSFTMPYFCAPSYKMYLNNACAYVRKKRFFVDKLERFPLISLDMLQ